MIYGELKSIKSIERRSVNKLFCNLGKNAAIQSIVFVCMLAFLKCDTYAHTQVHRCHESLEKFNNNAIQCLEKQYKSDLFII